MTELYKRLVASPDSSSKKSSRASTRAPSRSGFNDDDNELINDINFGNIDELLSQRLNAVFSTFSSENSPKDTLNKLNSINAIIDSLGSTDVSSDARQFLLDKLYNLIINKPNLGDEYEDGYDFELDLLKLLKSFLSNKSPDDAILYVRALTSFIITNIDNASAVFSEDRSINILSILEKRIVDDSFDIEIRQCLIYSYTSLILAMYDGSGAFGVEDNLQFLTEILSNYLADLKTNSSLIVATIYGIGSTLTILIDHSNLNEKVEDVLEEISDVFVSSDIIDVVKSAAMLFGLGYEIYDYDDNNINEEDIDEDDDYTPLPYLNTYEIESRLDELVKLSSKKISKKDKREGRSLYRDVAKTVQLYSSKKARLERYKPKDKDSDREEFVLSHIKLSKSRSLAVNSWFAFFRLIQLKWVYSSGTHTQLANNDRLKDIIRDKPEESYAAQFQSTEELDEGDTSWGNQSTIKSNNKKRTQKIESGRKAKLDLSLEQSGVTNEEEDLI
ncbi:hypothetical protein WICMUC_004125 [Wickerhamomyces mucosus]|uniref:Interferon-related developmental regulator N-terminal domain-containing protein n=1 Tax=Wickerhamomyces mucosus TaxID=1378264 RepID=A0A9P8PK11_9ASCO|nr:hypothetical protein WICMUC_004125 [Wickerhamomyces mucosus]